MRTALAVLFFTLSIFGPTAAAEAATAESTAVDDAKGDYIYLQTKNKSTKKAGDLTGANIDASGDSVSFTFESIKIDKHMEDACLVAHINTRVKLKNSSEVLAVEAYTGAEAPNCEVGRVHFFRESGPEECEAATIKSVDARRVRITLPNKCLIDDKDAVASFTDDILYTLHAKRGGGSQGAYDEVAIKKDITIN